MVKDAYYMQHDVNSQRDEKVLEMRSEWGTEGYGLFWLINEYLREQSDCKANASKINAIAFTLHEDAEKIEKFIHDCTEKYNLYETDGNFFWSKRLLKDKKTLDNKRDKAKKSANTRWKNSDLCETDANAMRPHTKTDANAMQGEERRGEESIGEDRKEEEDINGFIEAYKTIDFLPQPRKLSSVRKSHIRARIRDYGLDGCISALEKVRLSEFMQGNNDRGWKPDFDWLVKPDSIDKILSGKYDNKKKTQTVKTTAQDDGILARIKANQAREA